MTGRAPAWLLCGIYRSEYIHGLILTAGGTRKLTKEVASDNWQKQRREGSLDDRFSFWEAQVQVISIKEFWITPRKNI